MTVAQPNPRRSHNRPAIPVGGTVVCLYLWPDVQATDAVVALRQIRTERQASADTTSILVILPNSVILLESLLM